MKVQKKLTKTEFIRNFSNHLSWIAMPLMFLVCGCTGLREQSMSSHWEALARAQDVECSPLPLTEQVIATLDLKLFPGPQGVAVSKVLLRNAKEAYVTMPFAGEVSVPAEQVLQMKLHQTAKIVGGSGEKWLPNLVYLARKSNTSSKLEFYSTAKKPTLSASYTIPFRVADGRFIASGNQGGWLLFKEHSPDKSLDDVDVQLAHLSFGRGKQDVKIQLASLSFGTEFPRLVLSPNKKSLRAIWSKTHQEKTEFFTAFGSLSGSWSDAMKIDLPITGVMESWDLAQFHDAFLLAIVDGDSFAGDASLKVARLISATDSSLKVSWVKTKSLLSTHVSAPAWFVSDQVAYVLLPKWLDGESTVATYKLSAEGIESLPDMGVFPQGIQIIGGELVGEKKIVAAVQAGAELGLAFQLCEMNSI